MAKLIAKNSCKIRHFIFFVDLTSMCILTSWSNIYHRNYLRIKFLINWHLFFFQKKASLNRSTKFWHSSWLLFIWKPETVYFLNLIRKNISLWCPPLLFCTVRLQKHHTSFKQSSLCLLHPSCFSLDFCL